MIDQFDVIIVGAGWYGLAAAKVQIELYPTRKILVLEAERTCGGTWSKDRIYPGLKSNNLHGSYEYPDFPMSVERYGVKSGEHIPGIVIHRYLTDFAKRFGVFERAQFSTKVVSISPNKSGGWTIETSSDMHGPKIFETTKLVLATGLTSSPNLPDYKGADTFGQIFHAKDFALNSDTTNSVKTVVVVGGGKSAFDIAHAYVEAGASVDFVIRPTGNGPIWIAPPWVMGGKKKLEKLLHVRWMTWFSPCPFGDEDGFSLPRRFLHGTPLGRWIVDKFWSALAADVLQLNNYDSNEETKKLKPWNAAFWIGSALSVFNYDSDFLQFVRTGRIRVHIADISFLSRNKVHLSTDEVLSADLLVCATGWKRGPSLHFENFGQAQLGFDNWETEKQALISQADEDIFRAFPSLIKQPQLKFEPKSDPFRMYRFAVPPTRLGDRNIAFAGLISSVSTTITASVQALWIAAFLEGKLDRKPQDNKSMTREIMLHTQWGKWRYPCGYGASFPDLVFDAVPYIDLLLNDLSVKVRRKSSWWNEITSEYGAEDYSGLVDEWRDMHDI